VLDHASTRALEDFALTPREAEVLRMIAQGLTNSEVAARLGVTVHAVKFHLSHVYRKLGVSNRTEAAVVFQLGSVGRQTSSNGGEAAGWSPAEWRERVYAASPFAGLPTAGARGEGVAASALTADLGASAGAAVDRLRADASLEAVGLAALAAVLHRYSGDEALTFAIPDETAGILSLVAVDVAPHDGFDELVRNVSTALQAAQRVAASDLRAALDTESRDEAQFPISFSTSPRSMTDGPFDLCLAFDDRSVAARFRPDLFTDDVITRLVGHVDALLAAAGGNPTREVATIPLLSAAEEEQFAAWNATKQEFPRRCLHELLSERAARLGDRTAVVGGDEQLSYTELDRRSNQLAHHLAGLGVEREEAVGICVERSAAMVVGLLGILKAGAAYVPIDPTYPEERQTHMLEDAQVRVIVTEERLLSSLPVTDARHVCLDRDRDAIQSAPSGPPNAECHPEQLAYVIYTSGSTGKPKGVEIPHGALVNFLTTMGDRPGLGADDVLLAVTTLSFDIAGLELYLPLLVGGTLVVAGQHETGDPRRLMELMERHRVSVMQATPTTWRMLIDAGWSGHPGLKVLCGGEALPALLAEQLLERDVALWNMYGPTETTIWSTTDRLRQGEPLTIGGPIGNTALYVLDGNLQRLPVGLAGELHIGGLGLARGYRNRPDLTSERFIPDPFAGSPDARMYKTGDLVRYRSDGRVEFLGRLDHQVKVRGFRIELGEIESVLTRHPAVNSAVAVAREDTPGDPRIVAYVILEGTTATPSELRDHSAQSLPGYMVPSAVVVLDEFPQTLNGKVDRKALPAPAFEREETHTLVAPRSPLEQRLAQVWEDVLGIAPIGVTDDFFSLGVTSLTAARLFARIEDELGSGLPLAPVFQAPTIEALAQLIEGGSSTQRWSSLVPIQPSGPQTPLFCVHGGAGTVLHLQPLAAALGVEHPFYGLQARGLYGRDLPLTTVEAMSEHYLAELREVQPAGPYLLAGYCFGAIVAFDMAQRLLRSGEEVALLTMINGPSPSYIKRYGPATPLRIQQRTASSPRLTRAQRIVRLASEPQRLASWSRWATQRAKLSSRYALEDVRFTTRMAMHKPLPDGLRDQYFIRISAKSERAYEPDVYPGRIVLFAGAGLYRDPELGWGAHAAAGVEAIEIPGDHPDNREAMKQPYVDLIAKRLQPLLDEAGTAIPA
jgi:amino acid adenylation domain-containing protein